MTLQEKLNHLINNHMQDWLKTRQIVEDELSDAQPMFCVCGRMATGFHERTCRKYAAKVNSETVKRLANLIPGRQK